MTSLCTSFRPAPTSIARVTRLALLGGASAALFACSDPLPPPAEAALSIAKEVALSPASEGLGVCPEVHGRLMFPAQMGPLVLNSTTPASTVLDSMVTMDSGVRCSVKGSDGNYTISARIDRQGVGLPGEFDLSAVTVQNGRGVAPASISWLYQGFPYSGQCTVTVDERPPTEEAPDGFFVEPGMAKLSFLCDPFENADAQACRSEGTLFVRNCSK